MYLHDTLRNSTLLFPNKTTWFGRNRRFTLIVLGIAIVIPIFSVIVLFLPIIVDFIAGSNGTVHRFVQRVGWPAPIVVGTLYTILSVFLVPAPILALLVAVLCNKLWVAVVTSYVGGLVGSCIAFFFGRKRILSLSFFERLAETNKFFEIDAVMNSVDRKFWVVILLRVSPWMGYSTLNYALSLTLIGFRQYFLGTFFGLIPYNVLSVFLAWASVNAIVYTDIKNLFINIYLNGTVAAVSIVVVVFLSHCARRQLAKALLAPNVDTDSAIHRVGSSAELLASSHGSNDDVNPNVIINDDITSVDVPANLDDEAEESWKIAHYGEVRRNSYAMLTRSR